MKLRLGIATFDVAPGTFLQYPKIFCDACLIFQVVQSMLYSFKSEISIFLTNSSSLLWSLAVRKVSRIQFLTSLFSHLLLHALGKIESSPRPRWLMTRRKSRKKHWIKFIKHEIHAKKCGEKFEFPWKIFEKVPHSPNYTRVTVRVRIPRCWQTAACEQFSPGGLSRW